FLSSFTTINSSIDVFRKTEKNSLNSLIIIFNLLEFLVGEFIVCLQMKGLDRFALGCSRSVPADGSRSVPTDWSRSVPPDWSRSVPADGSRSVPTDWSRSVPPDWSRSVPADWSRSVPADW
nr:hypothetical protein [Tanacetum cinerariifolium]